MKCCCAMGVCYIFSNLVWGGFTDTSHLERTRAECITATAGNNPILLALVHWGILEISLLMYSWFFFFVRFGAFVGLMQQF